MGGISGNFLRPGNTPLVQLFNNQMEKDANEANAEAAQAARDKEIARRRGNTSTATTVTSKSKSTKTSPTTKGTTSRTKASVVAGQKNVATPKTLAGASGGLKIPTRRTK